MSLVVGRFTTWKASEGKYVGETRELKYLVDWQVREEYT